MSVAHDCITADVLRTEGAVDSRNFEATVPAEFAARNTIADVMDRVLRIQVASRCCSLQAGGFFWRLASRPATFFLLPRSIRI